MRGRLWLLWSVMTFAGLFVCLMGIAGDSFNMTIAFIVLVGSGIGVSEVWYYRACMPFFGLSHTKG